MEEQSENKQMDPTLAEEKNEGLQDNAAENDRKHQVNWNPKYASLVCVLVPVLVMLLLNACHPSSDPSIITVSSIWDWDAAAMVVLFTLIQAGLYYLPVGRVMEGIIGPHDKRLKYNINGLHAGVVSVLALVCVWWCGVFRCSSVSSRVIPLISAGWVLSFLICVFLYIRTNTHSNTAEVSGLGHVLEGFVLGQELHPRVGKIDVKLFAMVRIGFMGWALIDVCYVLSAVETHGSVPLSLLLTAVLQLIYITDALIDEEILLDSKELTMEPIGFLMVQGEYVWMPFFSSIPLYFLLQHPTDFSFLYSLPIILLFSGSFLIYRLSTKQKNLYRKNPDDPSVAHLEALVSPSGQNLLVSGWFGWVRHPNYLGDCMMTFSWTMFCGFSSVLPYVPGLHCLKMLLERATDIERLCEEKHGAAWREYCRRVPYKILPSIY
ncbi:delta(14)-sterol reductase TM7SF2 [Clarias gariepinus]|uniref:delta(14)-sterol reductase TM7SF2 n=1 Tax=Clarias gariepinus TaxID=13013 RepID=UPI00234DE80F|nr:delta(14)-sterol reductase TM7SF2 [Clarias gariepinus]